MLAEPGASMLRPTTTQPSGGCSKADQTPVVTMTWPAVACPSRRAARFTTSPMTVYSMRSGLSGFTDRTETDTFQLWSQDRDMSFQDVPFGGFVDGEAVHVDKVVSTATVSPQPSRRAVA